MPKPNKKRVEERQDPNKRLKGHGKLYIPEGLTADPVERPDPDFISDEELERHFTEMLSSKQGYGKNYRRTRPTRD